MIANCLSNWNRKIGAPGVRGEFIRSTLAGGLATLCDFTVLILLVSGLGWNYLAANGIGYMAGNTVNYVLNVNWVFPNSARNNGWTAFLYFTLLGVLGLAFSQLFMYALIQGMAAPYLLAKAVSTVGTLLVNFVMRKYLLFNQEAAEIA